MLAQGKDSNAHGHHAGGAKAAISAAIGWVEKELEEVASVTGGHVQKPYAPYKDPNDPFRFLSVFKVRRDTHTHTHTHTYLCEADIHWRVS